MIKVLTVIGTRPEAIKLAPVIQALGRHPETFECKVCVTHQHRELLDPMLELFNIQTDYDLQAMAPGQTLTGVTTAVLEGMEPILSAQRPDWVILQGDTTTVMAASLAAFYQKVRVAHVEAGLRTFDMYSPYPEEVNRRLAAVIAQLHLSATELSATNLRREGVPVNRISVTGNTVIDSLHKIAAEPFDVSGTPLARLQVAGRRVVTVTAHRRESFGEGMHNICRGVRQLAQRHPDVLFAYPVHLNPQASGPAREHLSDLDNVVLLPPLDYREFVWLLNLSSFVVTDSGGLQEEAAGLGKPALVLRENTERPEGVDAGIARLVGTDQRLLVEWGSRLLTDPLEYQAMANAPCPYGDGMAAERIIDALMGQHAGRRRDDHVDETLSPPHRLDDLVRQDEHAPRTPHFGRRSSDRRAQISHGRLPAFQRG
jgi:UDP-N-acetylglucosamine 2-epimerase (non-hydrolysing)